MFRVTASQQGISTKSLVNLYSYEAEDFEAQAIHLKQLYYAFRAKQIVIDANGLGIGLIDFMTKSQVNPDTGETYPPFGVSGGNNEEVANDYRKIKGPDVEENAMYLIKANAPFNTEAHTNAQAQLSSGKIRFLVDEKVAKIRMTSNRRLAALDSDGRAAFLRPYVLTTSLREQLLNLVEENEGVNIILKQASKSIKKDKFSAFEYGLYYIKQIDDKKKQRGARDISKLMFFSSR